LSEPITYESHGRQLVTVVTGFGGPAANFGTLSTQFGWQYRTQKRRVLTFSLQGTAKLPPADPKEPVVPARSDGVPIDATKAALGAILYQPRCFYCHGVAAIAGGNAPDLRGSTVPLSAEAFAQVVHDGLLVPQGMPKFDQLSADDLANLRQYIRSEAERAAQ
jgi:quinohemoprotein ethanol dehydrogenase